MIFLEWLAETLGLGALKIWLASRKSTAEQLGQQEELAGIEKDKVDEESRIAQAAMDGPKNKDELLALIKSGKVCVALFLIFLSSCADKPEEAKMKIASINCDKIRTWTPNELGALYANLDMIPSDSPIITMGDEWETIRSEAKACNGEK